jgi:HEAT repeat protein
MDVYFAFLKTVFQTVITLLSAAATLFTTAPAPPAHSDTPGVSLRRASLVWQADPPRGFAARPTPSDLVERTRAACELQQGPSRAADLIPALVAALKDAEVEVRRQAAWALGVVGR